MAKRFTDTDKWKQAFLRGLKAPYKLLWLYLQDDCNHAGIWDVDIEVAQVRTGEKKLTIEGALQEFDGAITVFDNGQKWFIPDFIEFQYGELNPENRAHNSVIKLLLKYDLINEEGAIKPLVSPLKGAIDKDKVRDMDKDKVKEKTRDKKSTDMLFKDSPEFDLTFLTQQFWGTQYQHANIAYYHEAALNWSDSGGKKKKNWTATIRNFMLRDAREKCLVVGDLTQDEQIKGIVQTIQNFDRI
jgi:hypothetical protein